MDKRLIRRQVGATSLSLPQLGFGSAHIGGMRARVPDAEARGAMQAAWDGGIRYYDTAPFYALGLSEQRLGNFLLNFPRDEFILTTKIGRVLHRPKDPKTFDRGGWVGGLNFEIEWDYSYDGVMRSYEQSLVRMGLDTIDALLVHDLDASGHGEHFEGRVKALEATGMKALEELKRNGDIKAIGMGINSDVSLATVATRVKLDFVLVAMPYTLVDQSALHTGFEYCRREGMSVVIGAPFASGILVTGSGPGARYRYREAPEEIQAKVRGIEAVCRSHGVQLAAAAMQFPLAHPLVASIIPGAANAREAQANIAAFEAPIPAGFWADLKAQGLIDPAAPVPA